MNAYKVATSFASVVRFRFISPSLIKTKNSSMLRVHFSLTKTQNKATFTTTVVRENPKKPIRATGSSHQRIYKEAEPYYLDTFQTPKESKRKTYSPFVTRILVRLGKLLGYYDLPVQAIRVTREMYQMCALRLDENREFFIDTCGLPDSFQTWFQITLLHVWMLMVRFRPENDGKVYMQQLVNHLFDDAEWRMREIHG
ncbi:957_t:CDS:2, partial [Dentiscutata heterogama]